MLKFLLAKFDPNCCVAILDSHASSLSCPSFSSSSSNCTGSCALLAYMPLEVIMKWFQLEEYVWFKYKSLILNAVLHSGWGHY